MPAIAPGRTAGAAWSTGAGSESRPHALGQIMSVSRCRARGRESEKGTYKITNTNLECPVFSSSQANPQAATSPPTRPGDRSRLCLSARPPAWARLDWSATGPCPGPYNLSDSPPREAEQGANLMNGFSNRRRTSWVLVLAVLFASPAWVRADDSTPDCYVLAIGVDNYARVSKLRGCVKDARGVAGQFVAQQGKRFRKVTSRVLSDRWATAAAVGRRLQRQSSTRPAGHFAVLVRGGHGTTPQQGSWRFLAHDYDSQREGETSLGDAEILRRASALADRGLKVLVIVDACHSGQLRRSAADALNRHRNPSGG